MNTEQTEALERLKIAIPYLFTGFQEAQDSSDGIAILAVAVQRPDDSGKMIMTINEPLALLKDIALVLDIPFEQTKQARMEFKAEQFFQRFGIKRG